MSKHEQPWTFEPFDMESQKTWVIYDENLARIVATFYNKAEAREYLAWRNKKQAKLKQARRNEVARELADMTWYKPSDPDDDDDGRC